MIMKEPVSCCLRLLCMDALENDEIFSVNMNVNDLETETTRNSATFSAIPIAFNNKKAIENLYCKSLFLITVINLLWLRR